MPLKSELAMDKTSEKIFSCESLLIYSEGCIFFRRKDAPIALLSILLCQSTYLYLSLFNVSPLKHGNPVSSINATKATISSWYGLKTKYTFRKYSWGYSLQRKYMKALPFFDDENCSLLDYSITCEFSHDFTRVISCGIFVRVYKHSKSCTVR